jgi:hypothetical protein
MARMNMTFEQMADTDVWQVLVRVTDRKPSDVSAVQLSKLAWLVWHERRDRLPELQAAVSTLTDLRKKRALYLLDSLRRYPVVPDQRAASLKNLLLSYAQLKPQAPSEHAKKLLSSYKLDKVAADWGLEDDARKKFQALLPYQTRHFSNYLAKSA